MEDRLGGADEQQAGDEGTKKPPDLPHPDGNAADLPSTGEPTGYSYFAAIPGGTLWMIPRKLRPGKLSAAGHPTKHASGRALGTRFRALYIVTDTSTKGVESRALRCVMGRIT